MLEGAVLAVTIFAASGTSLAAPKNSSVRRGTGQSPQWSGRNSRNKKEKPMAPSTKDQIQGKVHEVKGKVKETAGQATNNPNLEAEGQDEKVAGKIQKKVGQVEKVFEK
jgi:uncharacterized protein YjbJ (UPF0337 family)